MRNEVSSPIPEVSPLAISMARWALVLVIITLPWRQNVLLLARPFPPVYESFTDLLLYTHQIFLLVLLLLWAISLLLRPYRLQTGPLYIWWPLAGLTLAAVLSAGTAVDPIISVYHAAQLVVLALLFLFIVNEIKGLDLIALGAAGQILIQAVVGIGQTWKQHDLGLKWLGERNLDPMGGDNFVWAQGGLRALRAYGLSDHPNIMAAGLVFSLLLLLTWYFITKSKLRIAAAVIIGLGILTLFLTFSRPAWIAFASGIGGVVILSVRSQSDIHWRQWALLVGISLVFLLPGVWLHLPYLRIGTEREIIFARLQERINTYEEGRALNLAANDQFSHHALTGIGLGGLPLAVRVSDFEFDNQPARVTLITVAAEIGLPGVMFYFMVLAMPWLFLILRPNLFRRNPILSGLHGLLLALAIFSFYDAFLWSYSAGRLWQWLAWSLWALSVISLRYSYA